MCRYKIKATKTDGDQSVLTKDSETTMSCVESHDDRFRMPTLLVIDDEKLILRTVTRTLKEDYEVTEAEGAKEALRILQYKSFDIILCDVMMPDITGFEFRERLERTMPEQAERVVFMSGGSPNWTDFFAFEAARMILAKPFDNNGLRMFLERQFKRIEPGRS